MAADPCGSIAAVAVGTALDERVFAIGPTGILYTSEGDTLVGTDPTTGTVVFSAVPVASFVQLIDVAVSAAGEVSALDGDGRVVRFDANGTQVGEFGTGDIHRAESSLAVDGIGRTWVADPLTNTVRAFDPIGTLLLTAAADPPVERPLDVEAAPSGDVYVLDGFRSLLYRFDVGGNQLAVTPTGHIDAGESSLAVDSGGRVYLTDPFRGAVHVFTPDGRPLTSLQRTDFEPPLVRPLTTESHPDGSVWVGDTYTSTMFAVSVDASVTPADLRLQASIEPSSVAVGDSARLTISVDPGGTCPRGPFEIVATATAELQWTPGVGPGEPWLVDELEASTEVLLAFDAVVAANAVGEQIVTVTMTGPGVASAATANVNVSAPPATTLPPDSGAPGEPTSVLPVTGGSVTPVLLSIGAIAIGVVLVAASRHRREHPA